jgi:hypothetical protein
VDVRLRRGVTVKGRVVCADGKPVTAGVLLAPTYIPRGHRLDGELLPVRDGRFEVPGCDPARGARLWFYDPQRLQGAVVDLPGRSAAEPLVRLAPCLSATVRWADDAGVPRVKPQLKLDVLLRPGDSDNDSLDKKTDARLDVPATALYGSGYGAVFGSKGAAVFRNLIPGATYVLWADEGQGWKEKGLIHATPLKGPRTPEAGGAKAPPRTTD